MAAPRTREVVVITGASAGVGRAVAREFARDGAAIALIARDAEGLLAAAREVVDLGGKALEVRADVADAEAIEEAAALIEAQLGPIDIWVNNAMATVFSPVKALEAAEVRRVTEVTYLGYVHGTLSALRLMSARNRGVIVQVGSALAYRAIPLQAAYCAAKHAIKGFSESLRTELMHDRSGVKVTQVHLPAVNTPQFEWSHSHMGKEPQPVPPIYQPEVVARAIVWAARHPRREVWVGWPTVKAILAERLVPWYADWRLSRYGYDSQLLEAPSAPDRPDNLWKPAGGDFGAHGPFNDRATSSSTQAWLVTHPRLAATAGIGLAGLVGLAAAAMCRRAA